MQAFKTKLAVQAHIHTGNTETPEQQLLCCKYLCPSDYPSGSVRGINVDAVPQARVGSDELQTAQEAHAP